MKSPDETKIGKIINISGNVISVRISGSVFSTLPIIDGIVYRIGQVGSFLRIPLGYANLYGIVIQIGAEAIPESLREKDSLEHRITSSNRYLSMVLIGERIGEKFERGVSQFPTIDDDVHLVTIDDLNLIYGDFDEKNSIPVGNISTSESLPAKLDLNKLVTRHCAVVGSTGSGKSNAVAIILEAVAKGGFSNARILLIDPHGEYNESLKKYSKVFRIRVDQPVDESELYIPYWALPFKELIKSFPGNLNDTNEDYLRSEILKRKQNAIEYLRNKPDILAVTSDSPIPFSLKKLWYDLDNFERQTFKENRKPETASDCLLEKGDPNRLISNRYEPASPGGGSPFLNNQAKGILGFLEGVRNRVLDQRFSFLYNPGPYSPDLEGKLNKDLNCLLEEWLGHEKIITILDLSGAPSEIMASISGSVLKIVYDALFWAQNLSVGGKESPVLIVLEEAHNYLKAGEDSISSRTVQAIAKEGRKYGVGLLLVTQRPKELDETVLSQCGSLIALRMTNRGDRGHVAAAVQDELHGIIDLLPSLKTGEGIIMGEAVKIPSRVKFAKIARAPKSSDPLVSIKWREERPDNSEFEKAVYLWRSQKFK
ncbi:MAG: ATP-binding protein [Candidatus Aminicenantes bacterium]|nr:ATP-binding protein [Candidatus Aminicenantes bacterium]